MAAARARWLLAPVLLAGLLAVPPSRADAINVTCISNRDGTVSCQRLSDGKWFVCQLSVGGTSSCRGEDGERIICTAVGGGISECQAVSRARTGFGGMTLSVF